MLYLIGLGLGSERDITLRGLDAIEHCDMIYLECFTSVLPDATKESLEDLCGKQIIEVDREMIELRCDSIILEAKNRDIAILVIGDPLSATTHTSLLVRSRELGIKVEVIHNTSILTAVGKCGLQLYNYGQAVSLVFHSENWKPLSFYDKISHNIKTGLHTLCLLDIRIKERSDLSILQGSNEYEEARLMTIKDAIDLLIYAESQLHYGNNIQELIGVGFARVGSRDELIASGTLRDLSKYDFGNTPHTLVIAGHMHFTEQEMIKTYSINPDLFNG